MTAISKSPSLDICKAVNDGIAGIVARAPNNWGVGTLNPLDKATLYGGGAKGYLNSIEFGNTVACRMALYDCLFSCGAYAFNASVALAS